ncbi:TPA: DUF551 domain-containing protein [Yersinia enterocolitica]|nr:DUF551 domain-containing protein [Yersinia enterocolitica]
MKELDSFTVERLEKLISAGEAAKYHHDGVRVAGEHIAALAAIALAAKRAEPVAYITYKGYLIHAGDPKLSEYSDPQPLYDTPQLNSPEIPDGWIKCSDHRPEQGTDVQVYCSDTREQFVASHIGNGEFQYAQHEDTSIACRPSHWMPLPDSPEKP